MIKTKKFSNRIKIIILSLVFLIIFSIIIFLIFKTKNNKVNDSKDSIFKSDKFKEIEEKINYIHCHEVTSKYLSFEEAKANRKKLIDNWLNNKISEKKSILKNIIIEKINNHSSELREYFSTRPKTELLECLDQTLELILGKLKSLVQEVKRLFVDNNNYQQCYTSKDIDLRKSRTKKEIENTLSYLNIINSLSKSYEDEKVSKAIMCCLVDAITNLINNEFYQEVIKEQRKVENLLKDLEIKLLLKEICIIKQHFLNYEQNFQNILQKKQFILNHGFSPISYQIYQENHQDENKCHHKCNHQDENKCQLDQLDLEDVQSQINQLERIIRSITSYLQQIDVIITVMEKNKNNDKKFDLSEDQIQNYYKKFLSINLYLFDNFAKELEELEKPMENGLTKYDHKWELPKCYQNNTIIQENMSTEHQFKSFYIENFTKKDSSNFINIPIEMFPYKEQNFIFNWKSKGDVNNITFKQFKQKISDLNDELIKINDEMSKN